MKYRVHVILSLSSELSAASDTTKKQPSIFSKKPLLYMNDWYAVFSISLESYGNF